MSFLLEQFNPGPTGVAGLKQEFLGTGLGLLSSHGPFSTGTNSSPANSSQSDTATTADGQLSTASAGPAGDVASRPITKVPARTAPQHSSAAGLGYDTKREWMYRLVTFPHYFTPCITCCGSNSTPKREQLMTLFDTRAPHRVFCCHCPTPKGSTGHFSASHGRDGALLQVRRSSFKNAVNAADISRFGADLGGVQQYTLNGNKIIYLAREASAKKTGHGAPPPASCTVDGRAMMDKNSLYCSLMCKMQAEDPGFTAWLDSQDPSVRIMAQVAANAPPVPTVACKRGLYTAPSGRDSSSSPKSSGSNGTAVAAVPKGSPCGSGGSSSLPPVDASVTAAGGVTGASAGIPPVNRSYQGVPSNRPAKAARLTARSSSAPLNFTAASTGGGYAGSDALLLAPHGITARSGSGALFEGLAGRPVARQLLPGGPNAAAVEAAARQAAVAAAAAAFSGAGTSAAAAAARDALGAAGLAPIRTGHGSPLYSSTGGIISANQLAAPQQGLGVTAMAASAAAAAASGTVTTVVQRPAARTVSAFAAASSAAGAASSTVQQQPPAAAAAARQGPRLVRVESPRAPGLDDEPVSHHPFGLVSSSSRGFVEPFLSGTSLPGITPAGLSGFEGVEGILEPGFNDSAVNPGAWGSPGDISGLLGVADSSSPLHPGLDSFEAYFGDGSLSPAPQLLDAFY